MNLVIKMWTGYVCHVIIRLYDRYANDVLLNV